MHLLLVAFLFIKSKNEQIFSAGKRRYKICIESGAGSRLFEKLDPDQDKNPLYLQKTSLILPDLKNFKYSTVVIRIEVLIAYHAIIIKTRSKSIFI
jgi:hypothetical protein